MRIDQLYDNRLARIVKPLGEKEKRRLSNHKGFINNVEKYEIEIKDDFQHKIDNDVNTDVVEFEQDLAKIVAKYDNDEYEEYDYNEDLEFGGHD